MAKRIPIQAARDIAEKYGQNQVIVVTWDAATGTTHVVTYGKTLEECEQAAKGGNKVKAALGWPPEQCRAVPRRTREKVGPSEKLLSDLDTLLNDGAHIRLKPTGSD